MTATMKDASDFLAAGGTADQLVALAEAAPVWTPSAEKIPATITEGEPEAVDVDAPPTPRFVNVAELSKSHPTLREPIIDGLLRAGETMNVIAPPKTNKSFLVLDLSISMAANRMWLGRFPVIGGPVLILDNELHPSTMANRIPKVASARGVLLSELSKNLFVDNLRGRLRDIYAMESYFRAVEPGQFRLIILDAFYRFLPAGTDENSNGDLAAIYNQIDRYADRLKCAFVLIHHASKGIQAGKSVTDVGAGAGSQSRAADSHVILRQHEEDNAVVFEAAVRSRAPVPPMCLRWEFPVWHLADDLDPANLRQENKRRRVAETPDEDKPAEIPWTPARFVETFIDDDPADKNLIIARARDSGLSSRKADDLLRLALADKLAHRWEPRRRTDALRISTLPQPVTDTGDNHE
jgi:hypothetical protein